GGFVLRKAANGATRASAGAEHRACAAAELRATAGWAPIQVATIQAGAPGWPEGHPGSGALPHAFAGSVSRLGRSGRGRAVLQLVRTGRSVQEPRRAPVSR